MKADLHVHSTASDGTLDPADLVRLAITQGLSVLALTDHDSVEGLAPALEAAEGTSLTVIPAVELSSTEGSRDVHMLGYFVRHDDEAFRALLAEMRESRLRRAEKMVGKLRSAGYEIELSTVLALADGGAVGRSHVARALVSAGHAEGIPEAFDRLIGRGRPFYVSKEARTPAEAISVIVNAGGIAVVAHPGVNGLDDLFAGMRDAGLGGIEAYHADHTPQQREHYAAVARDLGLLATGGSDFHGPAAPNPPLGAIEVPPAAVAELLAWAERSASG